MKNIEIPDKQIYDKFYYYFGRDLSNFKDVLLMMVTGRFVFDIFAFNRYCKQLGYDENRDESLRDWINKRYGKEAVDLIEFLIKNY